MFHFICEANQIHGPIFDKEKRNNAVIITKEYFDGPLEIWTIRSPSGFTQWILEKKNSLVEEYTSHEKF